MSTSMFGTVHHIPAAEVEEGDRVGPMEAEVSDVLHVREGFDGRVIAVRLTTTAGVFGAYPWDDTTVVTDRYIVPRCGDTRHNFIGTPGRTVVCILPAGHDGGHAGSRAHWAPEDEDAA